MLGFPLFHGWGRATDALLAGTALSFVFAERVINPLPRWRALRPQSPMGDAEPALRADAELCSEF